MLERNPSQRLRYMGSVGRRQRADVTVAAVAIVPQLILSRPDLVAPEEGP
jgi:hypothetical protein